MRNGIGPCWPGGYTDSTVVSFSEGGRIATDGICRRFGRGGGSNGNKSAN